MGWFGARLQDQAIALQEVREKLLATVEALGKQLLTAITAVS